MNTTAAGLNDEIFRGGERVLVHGEKATIFQIDPFDAGRVQVRYLGTSRKEWVRAIELKTARPS